MKIAGFTFVRNAIKYDYPVTESIRSILPIVDEFIVSVGDSTDGTLALIRSINSPKIRIVESVWDDSLREGGQVLAVETDKAFSHVSHDADWAFYLQADEVVHEKYHERILNSARKNLADRRIEGLLFKYLHFYGTYDYIGDSRRWYNHEIRMIRNDRSIQSFKDAQGFRKDGRKLNVQAIDAYIYHYGWVKHPKHMHHKRHNIGVYWSNDQEAAFQKEAAEMFDYLAYADSIRKYTDTHPAVMQQRIAEKNWQLDLDLRKKNMSFKDRLLYSIEKLTGKRLFDYRNYHVIGKD